MYIPLSIKTNFSLLSSLIDIDSLIEYAKEKNIKSLAITDDNMFGMMNFYKACRNNDIKPIIGLEIKLENDYLFLYAKDYSGYQSLIKLSTIQSERLVTIQDVLDNNKNVVAIIPLEFQNTYYILKDNISDIYLSYKNKQEEKEARLITKRVVFVSQALYLNKNETEYLKYLYMIRDGKTIASDNINYDVNNKELKTDDIYELSSNEGIFETTKIADLCNFEWCEPELLLPLFKETNGLSSHEYLVTLSKVGLSRRLKNQVSKEYLNRLLYELSIIEKMGFSNYFLVVYDFIKYAKKNKILVGPGRGSGAGSLVCYSIGITDLDPIKYDLLFERFLNPERISMPDIDTDFPDVYRDQVIEYVISKYGVKKVSGIVTFGTLAAKQALRDVARVLNVPSLQVDLISKKIPTLTKDKLNDFYKNDQGFRQLIDSDSKLQKMFKIACRIEGFPRHTSSHAAGIVMCKKDLDEVIPLTKSDDMYLTGFSMEHLEELGLLKMDFLGLKTLTTIMNMIEDIKIGEKVEIDFNEIPLDEKDVLDMFAKADTAGIFQFESVGMRNFLRNLKPDSFEEIFAAIALFRPGPAQSIDSYIRRKEKKEKIIYLDKILEPILKSTKGIIIYQEQIIQIANIYAGYTLGEADILRRAMSKKKMNVLKAEEEKFIKKSVERGHSEEISKKIFDLILNFANYGFNRSHSVAYSLIAYKMAYLKVKYPKYFYANLLSSVIGSEAKTLEYINEVKAHNIRILKPSINKSSNRYVVEEEGIRFPLSAIKNIGGVSVKLIIDSRREPFRDIFDFIFKISSSGLNTKTLESLIDAGCFDEFGYNHNTLHYNLDSVSNYAELVKDLDPEFVLKPDIEEVEEYSKEYLIFKEKELFGFYLSNHPVTSYKAKYNNTVQLDNISSYLNQKVTVIVLVEKCRIIQTKKGEEMMFFDGSDEYAKVDFTLFPKVYKKYPDISKSDVLKLVGRVERRYDTFQIIVDTIEKLNN